MSIRHYSVTLDERAAVRLSDLAERLREAGFEVTGQLEAIGIILGRTDESRIAGIRGLRGVSAVEEQRSIEPLDDDPEPR